MTIPPSAPPGSPQARLDGTPEGRSPLNRRPTKPARPVSARSRDQTSVRSQAVAVRRRTGSFPPMTAGQGPTANVRFWPAQSGGQLARLGAKRKPLLRKQYFRTKLLSQSDQWLTRCRSPVRMSGLDQIKGSCSAFVARQALRPNLADRDRWRGAANAAGPSALMAASDYGGLKPTYLLS